MPTANPLEQLRRRMQAHASPAAFASLAEEHRRAGRLAEAIAVCRDGLARYPAYASARVTLGRSLLDSGDVVAAVAELEQAVAQAPDNLAAVRALEAARAALGDAPPPLPAEPASSLDLALHAPPGEEAKQSCGAVADLSSPAEDEDRSVSSTADARAEVFGVSPAWPHEFGLSSPWGLPPEDPSSRETDDSWPDASEACTQATHAHADAPTMDFTPPHPEVEEPAGSWLAPEGPPAAVADEAGADQGAHVASWALPPPTSTDDPRIDSEAPLTASLWDEPTIEAQATLPAQEPSIDEPPAEEPPPDEPPAEEPAAAVNASEPTPTPADGFWGGLFVEPVSEGATPAVFAGWDEPSPTTPRPPAWADEPADALAQASTSPSWDMSDWCEHEATPAESPAVDVVAAEPEPDQREQPAERPAPVQVAVAPPVIDATSSTTATDAAWEGSVAWAIDEVFARAGQPAAGALIVDPTGAGGRGPAATIGLADMALEAAFEDTARRDDLPPAVASLQQMLDAVRARRAALHKDA